MLTIQDVDVVVVGAGYAGLACARQLARHGLSVTVVEEKPEIGFRPHATGLWVQEATEHCPLPGTLMKSVHHIDLLSPDGQAINVPLTNTTFWVTDASEVLKRLAQQARWAGVDIKTGTRCEGWSEIDSWLYFDGLGLRARYLIGADGARSRVARQANLSRNTRFLYAMETTLDPKFVATPHVDGSPIDAHDPDQVPMVGILDPKLAPGHLAWMSPGVNEVHVGLASASPQHLKLRPVLERLHQQGYLRDIPPEPPLSLPCRGGAIPINGLLPNTANNHVCLIGDAAGWASPLTGGGILQSLVLGEVAADGVVDFLFCGGPNPHQVIERAYPKRPILLGFRHILNVNLSPNVWNWAWHQPGFASLVRWIIGRGRNWVGDPSCRHAEILKERAFQSASMSTSTSTVPSTAASKNSMWQNVEYQLQGLNALYDYRGLPDLMDDIDSPNGSKGTKRVANPRAR